MKKAMFFTLIAIILSGVVISSFIAFNAFKNSDKMNPISARAGMMNDFLISMGEDLDRALYISGYRALMSMEDQILESGEYIDSAQAGFEELVMNGTLHGQSPDLMSGQTLPEWEARIESISQEMDITTNLELISVQVWQRNPWEVGVRANFSVRISSETALWNTNLVGDASIPIEGFKDPAYLIGTDGALRVIQQTSTTEWGLDNLKSFFETGEYTAINSSPNFLMRLEGNLSEGENGIITLVNPDDVQILNRSSVDYLYFGTQSHTSDAYPDVDQDFRLDPVHAAFFGVG